MTESVAGVVTRVNATGFQLAGRPGWVNLSKFAPDVALPAVGETVAAELDGKGFCRRIEAAAIGQRGGAGEAAEPAAVDRETAIRLGCLDAAVRLGAGRPDVGSQDVLRVAELFEAWVRRGA